VSHWCPAPFHLFRSARIKPRALLLLFHKHSHQAIAPAASQACFCHGESLKTSLLLFSGQVTFRTHLLLPHSTCHTLIWHCSSTDVFGHLGLFAHTTPEVESPRIVASTTISVVAVGSHPPTPQDIGPYIQQPT
jgi:hypothetical protein